MADEQYRWLDRETAELLLRGESLEAVDAAARDQAERLAKTLQSLSAEPPSGGAQLPGEAAALAAFRAARSGTDAGRAAGGHAADAGLVRLGAPDPTERRPRQRRPVRFALTAVLAAGMVGGVAFAATNGILPTPFGGDEPGPAASVSAAVTPDRPQASPSPNALGQPSPDGSTEGSTAPATPNTTPGDVPSAKPGAQAGGGWWRRQAPSACRDTLGGRELTPDRKRALESAAGGAAPGRVRQYCKNVLAGTDGTARDGKDRSEGAGGNGNAGAGNGNGGSGKGGSGGQGDQNGQGGQSGGDDDGHHIAPGGGTGGTGSDAGTSATGVPLTPGRLLTTTTTTTTTAPTPSPSPSYSAL